MAAAAAAAVATLCALLLACAASDLDSLSRGWRPIPRERVFNWGTPPHHTDGGDGLIQVVEGPNLRAEAIDEGANFVLPANRRHFDAVSNINAENPYIMYRRAKKIDFVPNIVPNIARDEHDNTETDEINKANTYEVVENTTEELTQSNTIREDKHEKKNNFTDNLLKILLNYNIRSDDRLRNYALSLKQEGGKSNGYVPVRHLLKILSNYNIRSDDRLPNYALSLKHEGGKSNVYLPRYNTRNAPVDTLLAVLLSNYGHYLPGLFGYQHYRNLYGYSASNNIHNNKPFGSYKIFADTDSAL